MNLLKRIVSWILALFQKSETPEIDAKIEEKKQVIKDIDKELENEYNGVEDALKEWKGDGKLH